MATAFRYVVPPEPVKADYRIELKLSSEEAQALLDLYGAVGGHKDHSRRRHIAAIYRAIKECGLVPNFTCMSGSTEFTS